MTGWVALCGDAERAAMERLARSLGGGDVAFAPDADGLRRALLSGVPGDLGALVGEHPDGVSAVNLAAAVANDGSARCVVLARRGVSGSLRSRAARAGVDRVVDLDGGEGACDFRAGVPARADGPAPPPSPGGGGPGDGAAPILTFCSGRGGVGKTSVVSLCAAAAASWGLRVCAVDLDLSCGNLFSYFGLPHGSDLARATAQDPLSGEAVRASMIPAASGIHVLGPCDRPEAAELVAPRAGELLRAVSALCDLVLVDTSPTFTDAVAQAAQMADRLVLVSDGRPGSLSCLARAGGLAVRLGVARTRVARLENRASPRVKADFSLGRAEVGLEAARVYRVFEGGAEASDYLGAGQAVALFESGSPCAESAAVVVAQLLEEMGRLPACEAAERAARGSTTRRWPALFGRRSEVG